jgi:NADH-quinone oxidoreductase subunit H
MLGYDITVGLILFTIILIVGSLNFINIVNFQSKFYLGVVFRLVLFGTLINGLAETNRVRFDLPEAEAELVSGYNTEYSSVGFTLFFLAEYSSIIIMSVLINLLFFGGWNFRW